MEKQNVKTQEPSMQWLQCLVLIVSSFVLPLSTSETTITTTNSTTSNQTSNMTGQEQGILSIEVDPNRHKLFIWKEYERPWRSSAYAGASLVEESMDIDQGISAFVTYVVKDDDNYLASTISTTKSIRTKFTLVPGEQIELEVCFQTSTNSIRRWVMWSPLCKGMTSNECEKKTLRCGSGDKFLKFEGISPPDHAVSIGKKTFSDCESICFNNCSCKAYASVGVDCLNWFTAVGNITIGFNSGVVNLYVRVHDSECVDKCQENNSTHITKHVMTVAVVVVSLGLLLISIFGYFLKRIWLIRKERINSELLGSDSMSITIGDAHNNTELLSFSLRSVSIATGSFSFENKIGEGGFGSVYKGSLPGNREVAVKRLSTISSQGRKEFMNELKLIAKLQHTNLVRLLGCCVEENEQILMYEYMPNGSLDKFLFDPSQSVNLDWRKRFKIIEGIAQGLLYLHKYSRLRVIHRDLKASNVLLDQMMTPKISDFGLARIFEMNQTEDKTRRVVGTFGYMAPEYAFHGRFSERSDVFSFGVLLLEIVTGKRNNSLNDTEEFLTVLEWAWERWTEGRGLELIDPTMRGTCNPLQAVKCIKVGLLCVQEIMSERPTMSKVVIMLSNETETVPSPKKPAFTIHKSSQRSSTISNNEVTVTDIEPR